jgi:hypothetical protein
MKSTPLLLLVPLAWASSGFAQPPPQQPAPAHVWLQTQRTDTARTFTYSRFTLVGKFASSPHSEAPDRPALTLDCIPGKGTHRAKGKFLAGNFLVGSTLKILYVEPEEIRGMSYYPKIAVRYRTDDAKEEEEKWSAGTDKSSASIPKDSLKRILRARTLAIAADDDQGSRIAMQFDMPDATLVKESCNVDEH